MLRHAWKHDLTNRKFDRLTALYPLKGRVNGHVVWHCRCACGIEKPVYAGSLLRGVTRSCGCLNSELAAARKLKHGKAGSPIYVTWQNMLKRCNDHNHKQYSNYGGRGIYVCEAWRSFESFYADVGDPPNPRSTLDRKDNDGPYAPSNCRWASHREQCRNKRTNRRITFNGETKLLIEWSCLLGISPSALHYRLSRYPIEVAFNL